MGHCAAHCFTVQLIFVYSLSSFGVIMQAKHTDYIKVKSQDLSGSALNWAVALCEHKQRFIIQGMPSFDSNTKRVYKTESLRSIGVNFTPSASWSDGGPIIEREEIHLLRTHDQWIASIKCSDRLSDWRIIEMAQTPLVAAMRCYVVNRLGNEFEVPACLIE